MSHEIECMFRVFNECDDGCQRECFTKRVRPLLERKTIALPARENILQQRWVMAAATVMTLAIVGLIAAPQALKAFERVVSETAPT